MKLVSTTLEQFLLSDEQIIWFKQEYLKVYVRKGYHAFGAEPVWCLDIANITVEPGYEGQGIFTRFLEKCEQLIDEVDVVHTGLSKTPSKIAGIFMENVLFDRFANYLVKKGFEPVQQHDWKINGRAPSYFLPRRLRFGSTSGVDWNPEAKCS